MIKKKYGVLFFIYLIYMVYADNSKFILGLGTESNYKNAKFIKNETFNSLKDIFTSKDFSGEFKYMDLNKNIYYRKKYLEELTMKNGKIIDWYDKDSQNIKNLSYYFFDMNGDNIPELIVNNEPWYIYILTFDIKSKKVKLIQYFRPRVEFLGDNYMYYFGVGIGNYENYFKLNADGTQEFERIFYSGEYPNEKDSETYDIFYSVGSEERSIQFNKFCSIAKENKEIIYFNENKSLYCLRITEKQSDELMKPFTDIRKTAEENIKKVTYTYSELFGDIQNSKKVIFNIKTWSHPTKNVFNKYKININKVELIDTYPIFYVDLGKVYSKSDLDKICTELLKANGYWNFEIRDSSTSITIKVYGDKKSKKLIKWEYN